MDKLIPLYSSHLIYKYNTCEFLNINFYPFQFKEFIGAYNKITQMCFKDCVHDFTTRKISNAEVCKTSIDYNTEHFKITLLNFNEDSRSTDIL